MSKVCVIGAGPAGLIAAAEAAKNNNEVVLIEKNNKVGRKLYISGKGRCNLTNNTDVKGLISNTPGNGSFMYSAFSRFSSEDIMNYFEELGVRLKTERGDRVFPVSDKAGDVVDALFKLNKKQGVDIRFNSEVKNIESKAGGGFSICYSENNSENSKSRLECDALVIATGGISYPQTGSTGDGYKFAEKFGHTVIAPKASLVPMEVKESWIKELQGLSLKNVSAKLIKDKRILYEDFGEMLFTHYGVSGPIILSASRHIPDFKYDGIILSIDLKPALSEEKLDERILRDFNKNSRKIFMNSLNELLPAKLIPVIVKLSNIDENRPVNQITKEERLSLVRLLKSFNFELKRARPISEAIVTAGGINVNEISPKTMESKIISGLYFAGEIIDVDAYTGGFNLTIAFSTGYAAGTSIY